MTAATSASFPQTTGTTGSPISGYFIYLTPPYAQAFAVLHIGGADEGTRVRFLGSQTNEIPPLTPASTGSYTIRVYDSLTGGALLGETGTITVSAPQAPAIGSGVAPTATLDASVPSSLTSDSAYTTQQSTNGGIVEGWKDQTSNAYNFNQTISASAPTLVTNSQNGNSGLTFATQPILLKGPTALGNLMASAVQSGGSGLTVAMVFKYSETADNKVLLNLFLSGGDTIQISLRYGSLSAIYTYSGGGYAGGAVTEPTSGTLCKIVATYNPSAPTIQLSVNSITTNSSSYVPSTASNTGNTLELGGYDFDGSTTPSVILYEAVIWPIVAFGTGGATPTGDIATIMQYLTAKWAS